MTAPKRAPSMILPSSFIEHMEAHDGELSVSYFSGVGDDEPAVWEINYNWVIEYKYDAEDMKCDSVGGEGESLYTAFSAMLTDAKLVPDDPA